jgi:hypothetical protein
VTSVRAWTDAVGEPFRGDGDFWTAVAASVAAVVTFVAAVLIHVLVGGAAAAVYVVPVVLLVVAAVAGRRSTARTRPTFASREEWRDAERTAVASALVPRRRRS